LHHTPAAATLPTEEQQGRGERHHRGLYDCEVRPWRRKHPNVSEQRAAQHSAHGPRGQGLTTDSPCMPAFFKGNLARSPTPYPPITQGTSVIPRGGRPSQASEDSNGARTSYPIGSVTTFTHLSLAWKVSIPVYQSGRSMHCREGLVSHAPTRRVSLSCGLRVWSLWCRVQGVGCRV